MSETVMTLSNLRQKIRSSSLIQTLAPAMLGSVLLFGSSCSNARKFAGNPLRKNAPVAESQQNVNDQKVEHAIVGQSESNTDFIKLLQHKMGSKSNTSTVGDRRTSQTEQSAETGNNLITHSEDPFFNAMPRQEPAPAIAENSSQALPAISSASNPAKRPVAKQADQELPEVSPRSFVDTNIQLTSAETSPENNVVSHQPLTQGAPPAAPCVPQLACPPAFPCPPSFACPAPGASPFSEVVGARPFTGPEIIGDEYLRDGGDRGTKVYYSDTTRYGLDTEDTVVEWTDETGVARVKPSTRASIYAPRFGAVRSASLPQTDVKIAKAAGHQDQRRLGGLGAQSVIDETVHNDEVLAMRMRSRSSGVESKSTDNVVHQNQAAGKHVKLLNVYEDFLFFRDGKLEHANNAVIGEAVQAALDWNGDLGVIIYANDTAGQVVQGRFTAQDYTGVEDRSKPGDLTITKVVDKAVAKPGDELTFTIRFDNIGDRPLRNVRVVDNLSPRLEYIDGSVDANLDGKLDTESNGQGSQVLTFTFDKELQGKTGGWVSFKCRVR